MKALRGTELGPLLWSGRRRGGEGPDAPPTALSSAASTRAPQPPWEADRPGTMMPANQGAQRRSRRDIPPRERPPQHGCERDSQSPLRDEPQPAIVDPVSTYRRAATSYPPQPAP